MSEPPQLSDPLVHRTEVDGVPTLWVEAPPPFLALLSFRTGVFDETLLSRGVSHLTEHSVLTPLRSVSHPYNGGVSGDQTQVWASGRAEEVVEFLHRVCAEIAEAPAVDLDQEARVLAQEARERVITYHDHLLGVLFGPNGPGLLSYPEHGLSWLGADDVRAWVRRGLTAGNAVLALTGPPPAGLRLSLPPGERLPLVLPGEDVGLRVDRPTRVGAQPAGVAWGALGRRSCELKLGASVLAERLNERLRHELGLVYSAGATYLPCSTDTAFLFAGTDCAPADAVRCGSEFTRVLATLAEEGPTTEELERMQRAVEQPDTWDPAALARGELLRAASNELHRRAHASFEELLAERRAATTDGVHAALADLWGRSVAIVPDGTPGLEDRTVRDDGPLTGRTFRSRIRGDGLDRVVVGESGLAARGAGRWIAFRWGEIAMVERPAEDVRVLTGRRGGWIMLHAMQWRSGRRLLRELDARLPPECVLHPTRFLEDGATPPAPVRAPPTELQRLRSFVGRLFRRRDSGPLRGGEPPEGQS